MPHTIRWEQDISSKVTQRNLNVKASKIITPTNKIPLATTTNFLKTDGFNNSLH